MALSPEWTDLWGWDCASYYRVPDQCDNDSAISSEGILANDVCSACISRRRRLTGVGGPGYPFKTLPPYTPAPQEDRQSCLNCYRDYGTCGSRCDSNVQDCITRINTCVDTCELSVLSCTDRFCTGGNREPTNQPVFRPTREPTEGPPLNLEIILLIVGACLLFLCLCCLIFYLCFTRNSGGGGSKPQPAEPCRAEMAPVLMSPQPCNDCEPDACGIPTIPYGQAQQIRRGWAIN